MTEPNIIVTFKPLLGFAARTQLYIFIILADTRTRTGTGCPTTTSK